MVGGSWYGKSKRRLLVYIAHPVRPGTTTVRNFKINIQKEIKKFAKNCVYSL